jgi:hypothetical protein
MSTDRLPFRSKSLIAVVLAAAFASSMYQASAIRLLEDSFESPVVLDGSATDPDGWTAPGHPSYFKIQNEAGKNWSTPYGEQAISTYSNGVATKEDLFFLPVDESGEFVLNVHISSTNTIGEYRMELWADHPFFGAFLLATKDGDTDGSKDFSYTDQITWYYDHTAEVEVVPGFFATIDGAALEVKLSQDPNRSNWRHSPYWDNVTLDFNEDIDSTGPTLVDMVDDRDGGDVAPNTVVTYTVTFDEPMDPATVDVTDFGNAGSADITVDSVTPVSGDNISFLVEVRATNTGNLRLQINQFATLEDASVNNNTLNTSTAIQDDVTIDVDSVNPILLSTDIVDDQAGAPVTGNTVVTYTLTFSLDIDAGSVSAADFGNAGTAPITIGTIAEPTPGVFTVEVTPTASGSLQFQVNNNTTIDGADGGQVNTVPEIIDDTIITVDSTPPTLVAVTDLTDDGIANDTGDNTVPLGTVITYDVFFSEDMNDATVTAADFGNAITSGAASFTIDTVEESSSGVFRIAITTTGAGSLQLQINQDAILTDSLGNELNTTSAIVDDDTITVEGSGGNSYNDWISGYDVGSDTGIDDDHDGDGDSNGAENYFGTDPSIASQSLVAGDVDTGANTFTFSHPINDSPATDLNAAYIWNTDMSNTFYASGAEHEGTTVTFAPGTPVDGVVTVTATITGTIPDRLFVEVHVTQTAP